MTCEQGECGACSVLLDGTLVAACCVLGADAVGSAVTTVEGLSSDGSLTDVQEALIQLSRWRAAWLPQPGSACDGRWLT